jgi:hypothetical protein
VTANENQNTEKAKKNNHIKTESVRGAYSSDFAEHIAHDSFDITLW